LQRAAKRQNATSFHRLLGTLIEGLSVNGGLPLVTGLLYRWVNWLNQF
jgi:hypothetical protein